MDLYKPIVPSIANFFSMSKEMRIAKKVIKSFRLKPIRKSKQYILIEAFQTPSNRLGLSLFAPIASRHFNAELVAFYLMSFNKIKFIKEKIRFLFSIEKTLGCRSFLFFGSHESKHHEKSASEWILTANSLPEFESLKYRGIVIGDLIYDVYLRRYREPTLELSNANLRRIVSEFFQYFDSLYDLFLEKRVACVCVSHTVYLLGLPSRMAAYFDVPAFQVTAESIYRINGEYTHAYTAFKQYPEIFNSLPKEVQIQGKRLAKKRLEMRFAGYVGVDMNYSTVSAYKNPENSERILKCNSKPHILIAIHDFYDSPHSYGPNLYPDFYQWLLALADVSRRTDYNWYIKTHPDVRGDGLSVIQSFIAQNPQFSLIPSSTSHHQLIEEGITLALTIFGSIAMEYPYLGKPVVNASINNPHVRYDFSLSPRTVEEYELLLSNLESLEAPINIDSILEYYFIHNLYMLKSWFMVDYILYFSEIGGPSRAYSWPIFEYYGNRDNSYSQEQISLALTTFLSSHDTFLSRKHFRLDFLPNLIHQIEKLSPFDTWEI